MKRNFKGNISYLILSFFLLFIGGYYQNKDFNSGILITEVGLVLLPAIGLASFIREGSLLEFFRLRKISYQKILRAIGITLWTYPIAVFGNLLVITIMYVWGYEYKQMVPMADDMGAYISYVMLIGILPGICEEMLFRGYFLRAYQEKGVRESIVYTAFLFGIFHFNVYNFMGPFILAIVFGYMTIITGSIIPAIVGHVVNNTFSVTMGYIISQGIKNSGQDIDAIQNASLSITEYTSQLIFWGILAMMSLRMLLKSMKKLKGNTSYVSDEYIYKSSGVASHIPIVIAVILYIYVAIKNIGV